MGRGGRMLLGTLLRVRSAIWEGEGGGRGGLLGGVGVRRGRVVWGGVRGLLGEPSRPLK
jgi:hypothetical protein